MKNVLTKVTTTATAAVVASQLLVMRAFAALPEPPGVPGLSGGSTSSEIKDTIVKLLTNVLDFITLVGVVFVVVAGIRLIISGGDEGEKDKAKKTIIYVIIGIIVVLFARVIVSFVNTLFSN
jgi:succinate dehydrogenase/fumarate reductase cytochrome b subunit